MTEKSLAEWSQGVPVLALKAMAEDMPGVHDAKKKDVLDWLLKNNPDVLAESRRIEESVRR